MTKEAVMTKEVVRGWQKRVWSNVTGRLISLGVQRDKAREIGGHLVHIYILVKFGKRSLSADADNPLDETEWESLNRWVLYGDLRSFLKQL